MQTAVLPTIYAHSRHALAKDAREQAQLALGAGQVPSAHVPFSWLNMDILGAASNKRHNS